MAKVKRKANLPRKFFAAPSLNTASGKLRGSWKLSDRTVFMASNQPIKRCIPRGVIPSRALLPSNHPIPVPDNQRRACQHSLEEVDGGGEVDGPKWQ